MKCPKCGLMNPDTALRCDCGYDLATGQMRMAAEKTPGNNEKLKNVHFAARPERGRRIRKWEGRAYVVCPKCDRKYKITDFLDISENTTLQFRETDELLVITSPWAKVLAYGLGLLTGGILLVFIIPFVSLIGKKATAWVASCQSQNCGYIILVAQHRRKLYQVDTVRSDIRDILQTKSMVLRYFGERRYDETISELQRLIEKLLSPHPYLFCNIALCYEKMGNVEEAIKHYDDCRIRLEAQKAPNSEDLHSVQRKIDLLQSFSPSKG